MNRFIMAAACAAILSAAAAADPLSDAQTAMGAKGGPEAGLTCMYEGHCGADAVPVTAAPAKKQGGLLKGAKNGAQQGAELGLIAGLYPSIRLLDEGFGRRMSSAADGHNSGNGHAGLYTTGGVAAAVLLLVPALALAALGGLGGTVGGTAAEAITPGSTDGWDVEKLLG